MNFEVNSFEYNQRSILKSTRQKKLLSIRGSTKQVTFQFELPKITGEKLKIVILAQKTIYELTMGKAGKEQSISSDKQSGMTPFIYTPEEFSEDTATQN